MKRGRPPTWPSKISAPAAALTFYKSLLALQKSDAFATCHIYEGALNNGVPVISWDSRTTGLPHVVGSFLGLNTGRKVCSTEGCMNPFHYLVEKVEKLVAPELPNEHLAANGLEEFLDLIMYHIDTTGLRREDQTFEKLRQLIPAEDMQDHDIQLVLRSVEWIRR